MSTVSAEGGVFDRERVGFLYGRKNTGATGGFFLQKFFRHYVATKYPPPADFGRRFKAPKDPMPMSVWN